MLVGIVFQLGKRPILGPMSDIILTFLSLRSVSLTVFCILVIEYFVRYFKEMPARPLLVNNNSNESLTEQFNHPPMDPSAKLLVVGLFFESLFLYIRYVPVVSISFCLILTSISSVYRTIELADGFHGRIIKTEVYFSKYCVHLFESTQCELMNVSRRP